ncbi:MAG: hypothetical protein HC869_16995 [Rhodospirillales bacterium]|nr:hypothetical protein [Rhodospirillales bacterium]
MARPPRDIRDKAATGRHEPHGDPKRGDEILKRMLQSKPKPHDQMIAERHGKRDAPQKGKRDK